MSDEQRRDEEPPSAVRIKTDDAIAKGRFANLAQVGSSHDAFVLDFAFVQAKTGWLLSRLILSPSHAKRFHRLLGEALGRYEARFGPIEPAPNLN